MESIAKSPDTVAQTGPNSEATRLFRLFKKHRAFRIRFLMNVLLGAMLCAEAAVLLDELPNHGHLVLHVATWVMLILVPLTVFGILGRTSWGVRQWPQRFVVRPFVTLKTSPELSGVAIASLLHRQIGAWLSDKFNKSNGGSVSSASPTLSVGWVSVPLEWLWNRIRGAMTGRPDVFIDGLLMQDNEGIVLQAWVSDGVSTLGEPVASGPVADSLIDATAKLAFKILEELEPVRVAVFHGYRWRDDDAIRLMTRHDDLSVEEKVTLVGIYLEAERLSSAETLIEDLCCFLKVGEELLSIQRKKAVLRVKQGRFQDGRDVLAAILKAPKCDGPGQCEVKRLIAEAFAMEYRFVEAIDSYDEVVAAFFSASGKLLGREWNAEESIDVIRTVFVRAEKEMPEGTKREQVSQILSTTRQAFIDRARCWMLISLELPDGAVVERENAERDLELAAVIHNIWTEFVPEEEAIRDFSAATITSTLAQTLFARRALDEAKSRSDEAIPKYEQAPPKFEEDLTEDYHNMSARASLGWCYFGRSASWLLHAKLERARGEVSRDGETAPESALAEDALDPEGIQVLISIFLRMSAAERKIVDDLYNNALLREPGVQRDARLWKTGEALVAWLILADVEEALNIARDMKPNAETGAETFEQCALTYVPLKEAQMKTDLEDGEIRALVNTFSFQLVALFEKRSSEEGQSALNKLWEGVEANVTAKEAAWQFEKLGEGDRRAKAESVYGQACLAAILGKEQDAAELLMAADRAAGEGTRAYRNRAVLDKDFDWIRLGPVFSQVTGWPPPKLEIERPVETIN